MFFFVCVWPMASDALLVENQRIWLSKLFNVLSYPVYRGLSDVWSKAKARSKPGEVYVGFQRALAKTKDWSAAKVEEQYARTLGTQTEFSDVSDLLRTVFVLYAQILTSATSRKRIDIVVPKPKDFVHQVYIKAARLFYPHPGLMEDRPGLAHHTGRSTQTCFHLIEMAIESTVRDMLPLNQIVRPASPPPPHDSSFRFPSETSTRRGLSARGSDDEWSEPKQKPDEVRPPDQPPDQFPDRSPTLPPEEQEQHDAPLPDPEPEPEEEVEQGVRIVMLKRRAKDSNRVDLSDMFSRSALH